MGDFSKNPDKPFEVPVPNKIKKRIAMHETKRDSFIPRLESSIRLKKILQSPPKPVVKERGSMWSRFTNGITKFLK